MCQYLRMYQYSEFHEDSGNAWSDSETGLVDSTLLSFAGLTPSTANYSPVFLCRIWKKNFTAGERLISKISLVISRKPSIMWSMVSVVELGRTWEIASSVKISSWVSMTRPARLWVYFGGKPCCFRLSNSAFGEPTFFTSSFDLPLRRAE